MANVEMTQQRAAAAAVEVMKASAAEPTMETTSSAASRAASIATNLASKLMPLTTQKAERQRKREGEGARQDYTQTTRRRHFVFWEFYDFLIFLLDNEFARGFGLGTWRAARRCCRWCRRRCGRHPDTIDWKLWSFTKKGPGYQITCRHPEQRLGTDLCRKYKTCNIVGEIVAI